MLEVANTQEVGFTSTFNRSLAASLWGKQSRRMPFDVNCQASFLPPICWRLQFSAIQTITVFILQSNSYWGPPVVIKVWCTFRYLLCLNCWAQRLLVESDGSFSSLVSVSIRYVLETLCEFICLWERLQLNWTISWSFTCLNQRAMAIYLSICTNLRQF